MPAWLAIRTCRTCYALLAVAPLHCGNGATLASKGHFMAKATTQPAQPVLQVKGNGTFRGARAAWYATLVAHNGQPVSAWLASVQANHPSTPQRGKLAGKLEPPAGWLRWFVRNGWVTYTNP